MILAFRGFNVGELRIFLLSCSCDRRSGYDRWIVAMNSDGPLCLDLMNLFERPEVRATISKDVFFFLQNG